MEPIRTITPPGAVQQALVSRPEPVAVAQAVATELPAAKAVTAVSPAAPAVGLSNPYEYQVLVDPATHDVIYRTVDERSRQVVRQVPDQALLRMRAYARSLAADMRPAEMPAEAHHAPDPQPSLRQNSAPAGRNPKA
jgi:flagellar protein FlaG